MAIAAILLWIGGIEVGPNLHVALHARLAPHVHDAVTGAVVRVAFGAGSVAERPHVHPTGRSTRPARRRAARALRLDVARAGDSPHLHGILAWSAPPPPITHAIAVDRVAIAIAAHAPIDPISFSPGRAVARGPPLVTLG